MSVEKTKMLLQEQLDLLNTQRDEILAKSSPIREVRDEAFNAAMAKRREQDAQIMDIEKDLFSIDKQRAMLARALGGKRMSDAPAAEAAAPAAA